MRGLAVGAAAVLALAGGAPGAGAQALGAGDARAVRAVMDDSARAWNAGDLPGFLASYERGPGVVFVTPKGLVRGYDALAAHYRAGYGAGAASMGTLRLDLDEVRALGPGYAVVYGRFHLLRAGRPGEQGGVFDLILHKGPQGWRIVSDHTS